MWSRTAQAKPSRIPSLFVRLALGVNMALTQINVSSIKGEAGTGYEPPKDKGEFSCRNCEYFRPSNSSCGQKDMLEKSKQPRIDGRVKVDPKGCCEYVERTGKHK